MLGAQHPWQRAQRRLVRLDGERGCGLELINAVRFKVFRVVSTVAEPGTPPVHRLAVTRINMQPWPYLWTWVVIVIMRRSGRVTTYYFGGHTFLALSFNLLRFEVL